LHINTFLILPWFPNQNCQCIYLLNHEFRCRVHEGHLFLVVQYIWSHWVDKFYLKLLGYFLNHFYSMVVLPMQYFIVVYYEF
jgi:hypothetical protein